MSARPSQPTDPAVRVWTAMYEFVAAQDRRKPLRDVLDLGPGKVQLLVMLADGPMTLRDIAEAFGIDAPAATVTIDKLQARGLVKRTPHPDDNRRKLVHLTDPGREAAARGQQILTEPPAALAGLSAEDLAQLEDIMSRLDRMPPSPPALDQRLTPHPLDEPDSLICPATLRPKDHAMIHILGTEFVHFYLLEEDGEITLVDARVSGYLDTLEPALARMGRSIDDVKAIVLTHADPDHVGFAGELQRSHGIPVYVHRADSDRTRQGNTKKTEGSPLAMFPMLRHAHGRRALRHMIANGGAKQTKERSSPSTAATSSTRQDGCV